MALTKTTFEKVLSMLNEANETSLAPQLSSFSIGVCYIAEEVADIGETGEACRFYLGKMYNLAFNYEESGYYTLFIFLRPKTEYDKPYPMLIEQDPGTPKISNR